MLSTSDPNMHPAMLASCGSCVKTEDVIAIPSPSGTSFGCGHCNQVFTEKRMLEVHNRFTHAVQEVTLVTTEVKNTSTGSPQRCLEFAIEATEGCPICLEEKADAALQCGHRFCSDCLGQHLKSELAKRRQAWCPICRQKISAVVVAEISPELAERAKEVEDEALKPPCQLVVSEVDMDRRFRAEARRLHLKKCPQCSVPIQKNGGCPHMTCRCGAQFRWQDARTVVPCNQIHFTSLASQCFVSTCPGCSRLAKGKKVVARVAVAVTVVPAVALTGTIVLGAYLGVKAASVSVPLIACGPIALLYEPYRRATGQKHNRFAGLALSGLRGKRKTQWETDPMFPY